MEPVRPLQTEADYDSALIRIALYFQNPPERGSDEAVRFDRLAAIVEEYEARHWPIGTNRNRHS